VQHGMEMDGRSVTIKLHVVLLCLDTCTSEVGLYHCGIIILCIRIATVCCLKILRGYLLTRMRNSSVRIKDSGTKMEIPVSE